MTAWSALKAVGRGTNRAYRWIAGIFIPGNVDPLTEDPAEKASRRAAVEHGKVGMGSAGADGAVGGAGPA